MIRYFRYTRSGAPSQAAPRANSRARANGRARLVLLPALLLAAFGVFHFAAQHPAPQAQRPAMNGALQNVAYHPGAAKPQAFNRAAFAFKATGTQKAARGYFAANPQQNFAARFDAHGVQVKTSGGDALRLQWQSVGRGAAAQAIAPAQLAVHGAELQLRRAGATEWFRNTSAGLEQGFTLHERPAGQGEVRLSLAASGLRAQGKDSIRLLNAQGHTALTYSKLKVWDAGGKTLPARMAATDGRILLALNDKGARYPVTVDPLVAGQIYEVNSIADTSDGACTAVGTGNGCTLREAITLANNDSATSVINFNIAGSGVQTINLTSALPTISQPVTIDGYTQTGASANTLSSGSNAVLKIELNGNRNNGLNIGATNSTIKGLAIGNCEWGIGMNGAGVTGNVVSGNIIGLRADGTARANNYGVVLLSASNNTIGGGSAAERNVISRNTNNGVVIFTGGTGNTVRGNSIYANGTLGIDLNLNGVTANDAGDGDGGSNNSQNFPVITSVTTNGTDTTSNGLA